MKSKIAAALFSLFAIGTAHATVLSNGNFESGRSGWNFSGNVDVTDQYGDGFWGAGSVAQDGKYAVAFKSGGSSANGVVWQSFATTIGASYAVSFDYGTSSPWPQALTYGVYGASQVFALASGMVIDTNPAGTLDTYTFDFVANSSMTTLGFADFFANISYANDGLLDNVGVVAKTGAGSTPAEVPEPMSLALLGVGVLGLGMARRRKAP